MSDMFILSKQNLDSVLASVVVGPFLFKPNIIMSSVSSAFWTLLMTDPSAVRA